MTGAPGAEVAAILRVQPRPQFWTALEVRRWLEAIELAVYAPTFEAAGVQGADLIGMDADALKRRLGVAHLGHRTKLLKEIAVLANRAMLSTRRGDEHKAKDFAQKRKELLDTMYPDRVRRELKAQQDRMLLETRANFWRPEDRRALGAVDRSVTSAGEAGGARRAAPNRQSPEDNLIITEGSVTDQHRTQVTGGHPAQQRAVVRPATGVRSRAPRGGAQRPRTAGAGRATDRDALLAGRQDGNNEQVEGGAEVFQTPTERMEQVKVRIETLEEAGKYDELIKAWVEYGACVRMQHGDKDRLLVRTHFNLATTYLRQKLVIQALYHFKEADVVNQANGGADDALSFKCRIMEGMGICETRLGHYKAADALLEQAHHLCMKKAMGPDASEEAVAQAVEEAEVENINDSDGAVAGVLVAKSELYSAQADYDNAIKCLTDAYMLKEMQLGPTHKQIGKLYSALGTICQKQMHHKIDLLQDVQATLESAIRIRQEIQDKTEGIVLKGLEQEKGLEQLLRDIANMQVRPPLSHRAGGVEISVDGSGGTVWDDAGALMRCVCRPPVCAGAWVLICGRMGACLQCRV